MGKRIATGLVSLALLPLALTTACTAAPEPPEASTSSGVQKSKTTQAESIAPRSTEKIKPVWTKKLDPIGQPLLQDGVALVITGEGQLMELVALDVKSGKELWRKDYHPGHVAHGIYTSPSITEDAKGRARAIFLQHGKIPDQDLGTYDWTVPVAVDLKTGKEIFRGKSSEVANNRPGACNDGTDLCYQRWSPVDGDSELVHVDLVTRHIKYGHDAGPLGREFQPIGGGGLNTVWSTPERIARVDKDKVMWKKSTESVFGKGASASWGWAFDYFKKKDLFIGAVGISPRPELSDEEFDKLESYTVDLTHDVLAGIDATTGKVLWKAEGSDPWCTSGLEMSSTVLHGGKSFPVRCEYLSGTYKVPSKGRFHHAKARLVGYDPTTGKTMWKTKTVKVTRGGQLLQSVAGRGEYVLTGKPGGNLVVDATTGKARKASTGETFLCTSTGTYALPVEQGEDSLARANGSLLLSSCTSTGKKAKGYTVGAVKDIDNTEHGMTLISEEDRVSGFKLPSGQKS
ncbi:PQQ-binding-like beta-propeller repeat protein [Arthrobacter sp.]|uniref:outer membrane protein assembly factor BamB family protein n=1 Tax=Arthrobacter sp. TaxID=1667 RepID=UPI003A8F889F